VPLKEGSIIVKKMSYSKMRPCSSLMRGKRSFLRRRFCSCLMRRMRMNSTTKAREELCSAIE